MLIGREGGIERWERGGEGKERKIRVGLRHTFYKFAQAPSSRRNKKSPFIEWRADERWRRCSSTACTETGRLSSCNVRTSGCPSKSNRGQYHIASGRGFRRLCGPSILPCRPLHLTHLAQNMSSWRRHLAKGEQEERLQVKELLVEDGNARKCSTDKVVYVLYMSNSTQPMRDCV